MSCSDLTKWVGTSLMTPVMATRAACPIGWCIGFFGRRNLFHEHSRIATCDAAFLEESINSCSSNWWDISSNDNTMNAKKKISDMQDLWKCTILSYTGEENFISSFISRSTCPFRNGSKALDINNKKCSWKSSFQKDAHFPPGPWSWLSVVVFAMLWSYIMMC